MALLRSELAAGVETHPPPRAASERARWLRGCRLPASPIDIDPPPPRGKASPCATRPLLTQCDAPSGCSLDVTCPAHSVRRAPLTRCDAPFPLVLPRPQRRRRRAMESRRIDARTWKGRSNATSMRSTSHSCPASACDCGALLGMARQRSLTPGQTFSTELAAVGSFNGAARCASPLAGQPQLARQGQRPRGHHVGRPA